MPSDLELVRRLCVSLHEGGAKDVVRLETRDLTDFADHFIVCHAMSPPHMKALAALVDEQASNLGIKTRRVEGLSSMRWVIFDLDSIIVHLFSEEGRSFYGIEHLWSDAPREVVSDGLNQGRGKPGRGAIRLRGE